LCRIRTVEILDNVPALARELRRSKCLQKFFDSLPETTRSHIDHIIRQVKEAMRLRRAEEAAKYLMELCKPRATCGQ
jgi:hypothetical protein